MPLSLFESLESRRLFVAQSPTVEEVYLWELTNRARANPVLEAARLGINLNEGLNANQITTAAKQPLAINAFLVNSANIQALFMRQQGSVSLVGPGGSLPMDRMIAAGYTFTGTAQGSAENVDALIGPMGTATYSMAKLDQIHQDFFVDAMSSMRTDRVNMLADGFREIGVGLDSGNWGAPGGGGGGGGTQQEAIAAVEDFALSTGNANGDVFITGIAYNDANANQFGEYAEIGTGAGGANLGTVTVSARRLSDNVTFTTTTFPNGSGTYSLRVLPGTYDVIATGANLGTVRYPAVVVGSKNVQRDFTPQQSTGVIPTPGASGPTPNTPNPVTLTGDLQGKVYIDKNGNGKRDKDVDKGVLTGVKVYVDLNKDNVRESNEPFGNVLSNGTWNITGLATGIYRVSVVPPDGYRISIPDEGFRNATVVAGKLTRVKAFLITPRTIIAGTVYRDDNGDGTQGTLEKGLRNWRVYLDLNNDGVWQRETEPSRKTDRQGKFSFRDLVPATYTLRVIPKVGYLQTQPGNNGFYVVQVPAEGFSVLNRDFGEQLLIPPTPKTPFKARAPTNPRAGALHPRRGSC
jgi:hypothetical protein